VRKEQDKKKVKAQMGSPLTSHSNLTLNSVETSIKNFTNVKAKKLFVIKCPECESESFDRDGFRYLRSGEPIQRFLCRKCGYRFSSRPKNSKTSQSNKNCEYAQGFKSPPKNLQALTALKEIERTTTEAGVHNIKASLIDFAWQMKKQGYSESTIRTYAYALKNLVKHNADLSNDDSVKEVLAKSKWSNTHKNGLIAAFTLYLSMHGKTWNPPICKLTRKLPFIPLEKELDDLIAGCGKKTSAFLQTLKETALRRAEACNLEWKDVDFQRKIILFNNPLKNGNPRIFHISDKLISMLSTLPKKNKYLFGTNNQITRQTVFYKSKKRLMRKLGNPRLLRIGFHTFRHWKATTLYHQIRDIVVVKEFLGHKNLNTTLLYIQLDKALFKEHSSEFIVKATQDHDEIKALLKVGFEYVCTKDELLFFRRRK
jgi:integrase/recombinase XerD